MNGDLPGVNGRQPLDILGLVFAQLTVEECRDDSSAEIGISDSLVRLSVGVEDVNDLIAELDRVLQAG